MSKSMIIKADPEFVELMRKMKKEFDFESDRRTTKEMCRMLKDKKQRFFI